MIQCPLCRGIRARPLFDKSGFSYLLCNSCDGAWLSPLPELDAKSFYDEAYFNSATRGGYLDYARDEALHRRNARDRLGRIAPHRDRPGSLIDVGCAAGFFLDEAHRAGWRVTGIDVSSWARRVARKRFDLTVVTDLASLPVDPTPVDLVTFFQSLEHMADPRAAVEQAAGRLAVDGLVVIETWDRSSWLARRSGRSWQQVTPPSVLYLFSRKSLHRLLTDVGLEPVSMAATSKRVSVGLVAGILEYKRPALFGPLRRLLVKLAADRLSLRYRLGDLVTVVARKSV